MAKFQFAIFCKISRRQFLIMKSILKYPGSKWRIADWILSYFPEHKVYCEPFFGSGAVFFNKVPSYIETINDINGDIVNLFKICRTYPIELSTLIKFTPYSREEFIKCYERSEDPLEQARRTIVRYHQSFGTSNSSKSSWKNVQKGGGPRTATMWNYLPDVVFEICDRLKNAQIENTDALTLIKRYNHKDTLIYLDPPYLSCLRKKHIYKNELSIDQHIELLKIIKTNKSKIIISGYDNDLYNRELSTWCTAERKTTAQMGLPRMEKLWINFEAGSQLKLDL